MTLYGTPILYLNMGGEMLYVLRQRLKAQQISIDKTIQVLDDVIAALLNPKLLSSIFEEAPLRDMSVLRPMLEFVALSSIMKLDKNSMNKLFDLMIMMVKYQLTAATGPREVVLLTLNHIDAMRDMANNSSIREHVSLVHQMVIDFYGSLPCDEVWNAKIDCLKELEPYDVRVSILLRLGLQNDDCSFNLSQPSYDERYEEKRDSFGKVKLLDVNSEPCGSFSRLGDRITQLGRNIYSPVYGKSTTSHSKQSSQNFLRDCGTKAELDMLAAQLGTEETTYKRSFVLNLFTYEDNENTSEEKSFTEQNQNDNDTSKHGTKSSGDYKNKLNNEYADFEDDQESIRHGMDLLELLDKMD